MLAGRVTDTSSYNKVWPKLSFMPGPAAGLDDVAWLNNPNHPYNTHIKQAFALHATAVQSRELVRTMVSELNATQLLQGKLERAQDQLGAVREVRQGGEEVSADAASHGRAEWPDGE